MLQQGGARPGRALGSGREETSSERGSDTRAHKAGAETNVSKFSPQTRSPLRSGIKCEHLLPSRASKTAPPNPALLPTKRGVEQSGNGKRQPLPPPPPPAATCHSLNAVQPAWGFWDRVNPGPGGAPAEPPSLPPQEAPPRGLSKASK